jgi:hypothetical protein
MALWQAFLFEIEGKFLPQGANIDLSSLGEKD